MSDQAKANAIQDSSLASTQNMKRLLVEVDTKNIWCLSYCSKICRSLLTLISLQTEETGKNTLAALNEQGKQLDNTEKNLDEINADLKKADKHLTGMERWFCSGVFSCFNK